MAPKPLRILFSGDVGRYDAPLYHDPSAADAVRLSDLRKHLWRPRPSGRQCARQLCDVVQAAIQRGGVMLMAAFAVGRAQQLIYLLRQS